ncbi:MAG: hypothetical protein ACLTMP_14015 [Eggerthella lenta]
MIAEVLGTALWYGMTGIDIIDYDNTRASRRVRDHARGPSS